MDGIHRIPCKNGCHVQRGRNLLNLRATRKPQMTSVAMRLYCCWMLLASGYTSTAFLNSRPHHLCICLEVKFEECSRAWIFETFEGAARRARVCHSRWNCILSHLCKQSQKLQELIDMQLNTLREIEMFK